MLVTAGRSVEQFARVRENGELLVGGFGFAGFGIRFLNLVALKAEQVQTLDFSGMVGNQFGELRFGLLNGLRLTDEPWRRGRLVPAKHR